MVHHHSRCLCNLCVLFLIASQPSRRKRTPLQSGADVLNNMQRVPTWDWLILVNWHLQLGDTQSHVVNCAYNTGGARVLARSQHV